MSTFLSQPTTNNSSFCQHCPGSDCDDGSQMRSAQGWIPDKPELGKRTLRRSDPSQGSACEKGPYDPFEEDVKSLCHRD